MHGFCQQSAVFLNTDDGITSSESHGKKIFSVKERQLIDSSGIQITKQQKVSFLEVIDHVILL